MTGALKVRIAPTTWAIVGGAGPKGDKGDKGDTGVGVKGDKGDKGDQGNQGNQGLKGDQGIQGVKGDKGDQGIPGVPSRQTVSYTVATAYTLSLADEGVLLWFNASTAVTLTVPTNAAVTFQPGARIDFFQTYSAVVTVAGAGGVTIYYTPSAKLRAHASSASLIFLGGDSWLLAGDLA